jgi:catalase
VDQRGGERFWVKYHFISQQGIEFWTQEEGDRLAGTDPDLHTRDLYEAIESGDHPAWTLKMQIMPYEDAKTYRFNPFKGKDKFFADTAARNPAGRIGGPAGISSAALLALTNPFLTGTTLHVDGGGRLV